MHAWVSTAQLPSLFANAPIVLQVTKRARFVVVLNCSLSAAFTDGVEHDSDGGAEGAGRKVLDELGANEAALSVRGGNLTPDALVLNVSLGVVLLVDKSDALAVVEGAGAAVLAALNVNKSSVLSLGSLASLESHEDTLLVESTRIEEQIREKIRHLPNWLSSCLVGSCTHLHLQSNLYVIMIIK